MLGIIDSHVHVNEPGRTEWEGFHRGYAFVTIFILPLPSFVNAKKLSLHLHYLFLICYRNSIPPTITLDSLKVKAKEAYAKTFVDVAFWGGVIPGNQVIFKYLQAFLNIFFNICTQHVKDTLVCTVYKK